MRRTEEIDDDKHAQGPARPQSEPAGATKPDLYKARYRSCDASRSKGDYDAKGLQLGHSRRRYGDCEDKNRRKEHGAEREGQQKGQPTVCIV